MNSSRIELLWDQSRSKYYLRTKFQIVLVENDKIVNNTKDICDTFNTFFVNVANDNGRDVTFDGNSHPSILKIKNNDYTTIIH
jgi:hypothetical protein